MVECVRSWLNTNILAPNRRCRVMSMHLGHDLEIKKNVFMKLKLLESLTRQPKCSSPAVRLSKGASLDLQFSSRAPQKQQRLGSLRSFVLQVSTKCHINFMKMFLQLASWEFYRPVFVFMKCSWHAHRPTFASKNLHEFLTKFSSARQGIRKWTWNFHRPKMGYKKLSWHFQLSKTCFWTFWGAGLQGDKKRQDRRDAHPRRYPMVN